jgi:hypothetical protein
MARRGGGGAGGGAAVVVTDATAGGAAVAARLGVRGNDANPMITVRTSSAVPSWTSLIGRVPLTRKRKDAVRGD